MLLFLHRIMAVHTVCPYYTHTALHTKFVINIEGKEMNVLPGMEMNRMKIEEIE